MMITETIINFVQEIINFPDFKLSTSALQQQIQHLLFLVNITDCCSDLSNVIEEHKQLMVCMFASLSIVKLRLWTKVNIKDNNIQGFGVELQVFLISQDRDNKMELLQSQAPAERELLGNSAVRTLDIGVQILDIGYQS